MLLIFCCIDRVHRLSSPLRHLISMLFIFLSPPCNNIRLHKKRSGVEA